MRTACLTGFAGFIGYHFAKRLLADGWLIYGVDINPDSYNGKHIQFDQNFKLIGRDICDLKELPDCDYVFHLAAQTHVHNSIQDCKEFIRTNIEGTRNLLELIKNKSENILQKPTMVYFSTDEVYGDIEEGFATEEFPLSPTNNYCLHPNTKITLINGEDIDIKDIQIGHEIISYDFNEKVSKVSKVINKWINKTKKLHSLSFKNNQNSNILCTENHTFFIKRIKRDKSGRLSRYNLKDIPLQELKAKDIQLGDWIWMNTKINLPKDKCVESNIDPKIAKFLGYFTGDGCIAKSKNTKLNTIQYTIRLADEKKEFVEYYNNFSKNKGCYFKHPTKNCWYSQTGDIEMVKFIQKLELDVKAKFKKVPNIIKLSSNLEIVKSFLAGLVDADGHISKNRDMIQFYSVSNILLKDVHFMLKRIGINSTIDYAQNKVIISSTKDYSIFKENISCLKTIHEPFGKFQNVYENDGCWVTVTNNEIIEYCGDVYDIEIENEHNFMLSNGIQSHNSVTKAAADQLVQSYGRTYGMDYLIIRPTNNYGTHQNSEKFIPLTLKLHLMGKKVKLHNRGTPVRNWLHVEDTCDAVLHILEKGFSKGCQQIYNVGGNLSQINYETARQIFMALNTFDFHAELDLESHRPGQDMRYAVDCSKLLETNWKWKKEFQDSLPKIVQWYLDDPVRRLF
jgi:dTDP-D-glucose 4,6-dehydratase